MKARQTKYAAYATIYILVILAVLVVANFLANRYNKSYDATANKRFTLVRPDQESGRRTEAGRHHSVFRPVHRHARRQGSAGPLREPFPQSARPVRRPAEEPDSWPAPTTSRAKARPSSSVGARREDAKTFDEEGVTGALIRALKGGERTVCVVTGDGEHRLDDSIARRRFLRLSNRR